MDYQAAIVNVSGSQKHEGVLCEICGWRSCCHESLRVHRKSCVKGISKEDDSTQAEEEEKEKEKQSLIQTYKALTMIKKLEKRENNSLLKKSSGCVEEIKILEEELAAEERHVSKLKDLIKRWEPFFKKSEESMRNDVARVKAMTDKLTEGKQVSKSK